MRVRFPKLGIGLADSVANERQVAGRILLSGPPWGGTDLHNGEMFRHAIGQVRFPIGVAGLKRADPGGVAHPQEWRSIGMSKVAMVVAHPEKAVLIEWIVAMIRRYLHFADLVMKSGVGLIGTISGPVPQSRCRKGATNTKSIAAIPEAKRVLHLI